MSIIIKHINLVLIFVLLHPMVDSSSEKVYRYWKAEKETLNQLDLQTMAGKWICLYQRKQLDPNVRCHEISINSTDNYNSIDVRLQFESWEGLATNGFHLKQDKYLKGKLEGVQWLHENLRLSYTWLIIEASPNLLVFQITGQREKLDDNWLIYGRHSICNSSLEAIESGSKLLQEAGAYPDFSGKLGYQCLTNKVE